MANDGHRFRPTIDRLEVRLNCDTGMPLPIGPPDPPPEVKPPGSEILTGLPVPQPSVFDPYMDELSKIVQRIADTLYPSVIPEDTIPFQPPSDTPSRSELFDYESQQMPPSDTPSRSEFFDAPTA